ncbi:galanin receptor 2a-like [Oculina patagonica]
MNASNQSSPDAWSDLTTPTMKWVFRILFSTILFLGIFGNGAVCSAIILKQRLRTTANMLVFNLAAADFIFVALYAPTQLSFFENNYSWEMGDAVCKLSYAVLPACLCSTVETLLCIALLRYKAVASPFHVRVGMTYKTTAIVISVIWLSSLLTGLPVLLVAKTMQYQDKVFCDEVWPVGKPYGQVYWVSIFLIQYAVPLVVIVILSIATVIKVKQSRARVLPSSSTTNNDDNSIANVMNASVRQRRRRENNMSKMLTGLVILYAICMLPQHVVYFWLTYGDLKKQNYSLYIFTISNIFPIANSALNPLIYGSLHKELKNGFKNCVKCA